MTVTGIWLVVPIELISYDPKAVVLLASRYFEKKVA